MKILVLYATTDMNIRKTIRDHLYSFKNYGNDAQFHYVNAHIPLPWYLSLVRYDGIILHYTLLAYRWKEPLRSKILKHIRQIKRMDCIKVAIPQDEYYLSDFLCSLFKDFNVTTVFTCASSVDYETLYPKERSGLKNCFTTLTGFVDEATLEKIHTLKNDSHYRSIDIGYRARSLPYNVGRFSQLKKELGKRVKEKASKMSLSLDISTEDKDVFFGDEWLKFLLRCRTMLGCLGGSSLHDPHGEICEKVERWLKDHPSATFDQTEEACFKGRDYNLSLFALSPRHFECAMTKTCQVLVDVHGSLHSQKKIQRTNALPDPLTRQQDSRFFERILEGFTHSPHMFYEYWDWRERQAKYIANSVRVYEFFGHEWRMPFWDASLIRFWQNVPFHLRKNKRLFDNYLGKKQEPYGFPQKSIKVLMKDRIKTSPLFPFLKKIRQRVKDFSYRACPPTDPFFFNQMITPMEYRNINSPGTSIVSVISYLEVKQILKEYDLPGVLPEFSENACN